MGHIEPDDHVGGVREGEQEPLDRGADARPAASASSHEASAGASPPRGISRTRLILVNALIGFTTLLLVVGIFSVWANRLLFSPDNWSHTSTQLLSNPEIRNTTANYLVDQLYANVDVASIIKADLPTQLQPLAAPAAGALRNAAVKGVDLALTRPRVQNLWEQANRAADQAFIAVVNGGKGAVTVNQGVVALNLGQILDNAAARLGLSADISGKLPPNVANLTVLKSDQLKLVQNVGKAIKGLALWLTILAPLLYALAIVLAPGHRRRTLMTVGFAAVVAGMLALLGRSLLESQATASLTNDASLRPTITAVIAIATGMVGEIAGAVIFVGTALVLAGWFAGPARAAATGRRAIAPFMRDHAAASYGIAVVVLALIFIWDPIPATGKPAGMLVFLLLALLGTFLLRRQTLEEFPGARPGEATAAIRARLATMRAGRQQAKGPHRPDAAATMPEQLRELADLRDHGALSPEEYQAAKTQLLRSS